MPHPLFAIYIVVAAANTSTGSTHWAEFQLDQKPAQSNCGAIAACENRQPITFATRALCEHYRTKTPLVSRWFADVEVPFNPKQLVSTRCGEYAPSTNGATPAALVVYNRRETRQI